MSQTFPNGTQYSFSTAMATALALTAISNANPAIASCATPPAAGTVGVLTSGWAGLNGRVVNAIAPTSTTFELEGFDTTPAMYAPAGGAGTFQAPSAWQSINQTTDIKSAGGEQQFASWQYVEDPTGRQQQRPTYKNAKSLTLTMDYDPTQAWHGALITADQSKGLVILKAVLPSGDTLYWPTYVSYDQEPTQELNKNMSVSVVFSLQAVSTRVPVGG